MGTKKGDRFLRRTGEITATKQNATATRYHSECEEKKKRPLMLACMGAFCMAVQGAFWARSPNQSHLKEKKENRTKKKKTQGQSIFSRSPWRHRPRTERKDTMDAMPDEIILNIIVFVSPESMGSIACVSWRFNRLSMDESVWRHTYTVVCPPCTGDSGKFCMAHKGHGLDHRPWLDATGPEMGEGTDGDCVSQHPTHPLYPFLHANAEGYDSPLCVFAKPPSLACPHHCQTVLKARSYRWACASQCAPPRPIDATGVHVGCGPHLPSAEHEATTVTSMYRGEWDAESHSPDGLGMLARHYLRVFWERTTRTVGLWRYGDNAGHVRQWESDGHYSYPIYQEGVLVDQTFAGIIAYANMVHLDHTTIEL